MATKCKYPIKTASIRVSLKTIIKLILDNTR